eukprot:TRINITY_DN6931_c0_g1_i1.p1 TRINITY_DN6931_c0_g1~~TRINITY_DN6931_c0_g1_i1.p1  ORF type:complete len:306 (+),score=89.68 TRINITY_DN6931_c0_g1_i1:26-943(+)
MAERKAQNKYYPPEWDPSKGSINTFRGQHPLRERAKNLHKGILVIRFEMPWNIWCGGCGIFIAKGVRYNADKQRSGKYLSTTKYRFTMNCHLCPGKIVIETDPENRDYKIIDGAKRKEETWSPSSNGTYEFLSDNEKQKLSEDPFYKLEHKSKDVEKAKKSEPIIQQLLDISEQNTLDDFSMSQLMRKKLRTEKKEEKEEISDNLKKGINFKLLPLNDDDVLQSKSVLFHSKQKVVNVSSQRKRDLSNSIFKGSALAKNRSKSNSDLMGVFRKSSSSLNSSKVSPSIFGKINSTDSIKSVKRKHN